MARGEAHYTSPHDSHQCAARRHGVSDGAHRGDHRRGTRQTSISCRLPLFDGTDEHGVEDSFIVILDWKPPMQNKWPALAPLPSTRVHIAFFDHGPAAITPTYEVAMRYWENGVADDMKMNFGDFVMNAKMKEFAPQPHRC